MAPERAEEAASVAGRQFVTRLAHCLKMTTMHQLSNDAVRPSITGLLDFLNDHLRRGEAMVLQAYGGSLFFNHEPIRLDNASYDSAEQLQAMFARLGAQEIGFTEALTEQELRVFLGAFQKHLASGTPGDILRSSFPRVTLRKLEHVGPRGQNVDASQRLLLAYAQLLAVLDQTLPRLEAGRNPQFARARRALQLLVDAATGQEPLLVAVSQLPREGGGNALHLAATAALTVLLGLRLKLPRHALVEAGMAAAFHDFARGRPSPGGALPADRAAARIPLDSMVPLAMWSGLASVLKCSAVAWEHGLALNTAEGPPSAMARLVAVPCAWDLLRHPPPPRTGLAAPQALALLRQAAGTRFDPWVVRLLAVVCGVHPPGSLVTLTNGVLAAVVDKPDPNDPVRVRVRLMPRGAPTPSDLVIDLGDASQNSLGLAIAGAADAKKHGVNVLDCLFFREDLDAL